MNELQAQFRRDGVVFIENALDRGTLKLAEEAFQWTYHHPGPGAGAVLLGTPGTFYQDQANPDCFDAYRTLLRDTCIPDIAAGLFGSNNVWLLYEQIWFKDGNTRRTPWHQDLPYLPVEGDDLCVMWINLDPVAKEMSLEFVLGSHHGPLFNPSAFNPDDVSAALFKKDVLPPLPDIEATRDQWPIVSWATKPGDVVVFHPAMLHGGAPTRAGQPRRTLSLRFFGEHTFCAERPHGGLADVEGLKHDDGGRHPLKKMATAVPGTPFRHLDFPRLRP
jgi:hypothetical protein